MQLPFDGSNVFFILASGNERGAQLEIINHAAAEAVEMVRDAVVTGKVGEFETG